MTTTEHRIQPGQEYEKCDPRDKTIIRIRVIHAGPFDGEKALVGTIHRDRYGRDILDRRRTIKLSSLHTDGKPRRSSYRLVRHADGTPAAGGGAR